MAARAPCAIRARVIPKQMPEPPPVTNATWPVKMSSRNTLSIVCPQSIDEAGGPGGPFRSQPPTDCPSERCLRRVQTGLDCIPDEAARPVDDFGLDLLAAVRGQAVQNDDV